MRVFLAHPKAFTDEQITYWTEETRKQFVGEFPDVSVVPGRDDYFQHAPSTGTWKAWAQDVVDRLDSSTREPWYDVIVVPGRTVGGATQLIVTLALHRGRPVLVVEENQGDTGARIEISLVGKIMREDPDDFISGWVLDT